MNRTARLTTAAACAVALAGATPALASAATTITLSGSTASQPLVELLAAKYVTIKRQKVAFKLAGGGTGVGISDVESRSVDIANVSRDRLASDPATLKFYPIARYFLCAVTNKSNPVSNLTQSQLQAIFTGKVRQWSQVPGASASGTIDVYSRQTSAGVLSNFQTLLLGGKTVSSTFPQEPSEGLLQQRVQSDKNGVGFLSDYLALKGVNPVGYNGVGCSLANAVSGQYAGVGRFYEVTNGPATGAAGAFIHWIETSAAAKKIIATSWIPLSG
jgi:phosphate transport system substrate-binding protein